MSDTEKTSVVELVLDVDRHADLIYGTGVVWSGKGDKQEVPAAIAGLMHRNHPDVYFVHGAYDRPTVVAEAARIEAVSVGIAGQAIVLSAEELAAMSDEEVRAEGKARNYGLHPRLNPDNLRGAFLLAQAGPDVEMKAI